MLYVGLNQMNNVFKMYVLVHGQKQEGKKWS